MLSFNAEIPSAKYTSDKLVINSISPVVMLTILILDSPYSPVLSYNLPSKKTNPCVNAEESWGRISITSGKIFSTLFEVFSKSELEEAGDKNEENSSMKNINQADL